MEKEVIVSKKPTHKVRHVLLYIGIFLLIVAVSAVTTYFLMPQDVRSYHDAPTHMVPEEINSSFVLR